MRYLALALLLIFTSCSRSVDPDVAQMRVRALQTHTFVGCDAKTITKEIISTLQDDGYMIKNANTEIGLLTAEQDINIEKFSSKFFAYLFSGRRARWKKQSIIELTTNITEKGGKTKVRVNYLLRVFDNRGRVIDVHQILDEEIYTDFFTKVQKGLLTSG
ncbi:MAG: hypothetical protein P0S96_06500 [Simkaniaceae bacterium]|nr:hypothetical protein [Candidatus Sacchlamyda saccharinae]